MRDDVINESLLTPTSPLLSFFCIPFPSPLPEMMVFF